MGTNLSLSAEADARLEEMTEDRLVPVAGPSRRPACWNRNSTSTPGGSPSK